MIEKKGKLYKSGGLTVMCTGEGISDKRFTGVVIKQNDITSDFKVGDYSKSWTSGMDIFKEVLEPVTINNNDWKEHIESGTCSG